MITARRAAEEKDHSHKGQDQDDQERQAYKPNLLLVCG